MDDLRLLGALMLRSGIALPLNVKNNRLKDLVSAAREEITEDEDNIQFKLWKKCGRPHFELKETE